jgi:hypothetical protein
MINAAGTETKMITSDLIPKLIRIAISPDPNGDHSIDMPTEYQSDCSSLTTAIDAELVIFNQRHLLCGGLTIRQIPPVRQENLPAP